MFFILSPYLFNNLNLFQYFNDIRGERQKPATHEGNGKGTYAVLIKLKGQ